MYIYIYICVYKEREREHLGLPRHLDLLGDPFLDHHRTVLMRHLHLAEGVGFRLQASGFRCMISE